jgi:hypothetical protein
MIKAHYPVIAEKAILDKGTNKLSLINLLDGFQSVSFPFLIPEFVLVLKTERDITQDPSQVEIEIIIKQGTTILLTNKLRVDYEDKSGNNLFLTVNGFVVMEPLPIDVIYRIGDKEIASMQVEIKDIRPKTEAKSVSV